MNDTAKEITLEELEEDDSFFEGLRNEEFCLVLGAGFSFGIKNKTKQNDIVGLDYDIHKNIPLTGQFKLITQKIFTDRALKKTTFSTDANVWKNEHFQKGNQNLEQFFRDLFTVDEDWFEKEKKKLYKNILLPSWRDIYTLNFDNVLDYLVSSTKEGKKYKNAAYPSQTTVSYHPSLVHLHGSITDTNLESLIFYGDIYSRQHKQDHTLYDPLHGELKSGKKLLIIGTQFAEEIIDSRLFEDLPDGITIYHFERDNENFREKPYINKNRNYYHFIKINDISDIFDFLTKNRDKIKNIQLDGSLTINNSFIDIIKKGHDFSKSKFYSAKQDDNCQWYGIINDYDVVRRDYPKIKATVLNAFTKVSASKVAAVVYGTGGCGKSTLLRRLAIELIQESDFEIIWIKDRQFENFTLKAIPKIQADFENKYLIFIEDWYRLTSEDKEIGDDLLKTVQTMNNIRLVIGDREITGKDYLLNLINSENIFKLIEDENKNILQEVIAKHSEWKTAAELVLKNDNSYNSPLFLILFVIAGISERRFDVNEIDFIDLENMACRIAKYDLKFIAAHYLGFAKALHFWACVYEKYKIFISYNTFLKIADSFNGDNDINIYFSEWKTENEVLEKLKLYINVSKNENLAERFQNIDLVQFNHDKLAENVLSKVELENWLKYDDIIKKKLLNIITSEGDDYSASVVLRAFLINESQIFTDDNEKKSYIDFLFYKKGNRNFQYLSALSNLYISPSDLYMYLKSLEKEGLYHPTMWLTYFKIASKEEKQSAAKEILTHKDIVTLQHFFVVAAFRQPGNEEEKQSAAKEIIDFYHENNHRFNWQYCALMGVPLHDILLWKTNSMNILQNWERRDIRIVVNVLYSYCDYPKVIEDLSKSILINWKEEIVKSIKQLYGKNHFGDHIKIALGHPNLKEHAKKVANEILEERRNKPNAIPQYLVEIATKIVEQNEYPTWQQNIEENEPHPK